MRNGIGLGLTVLLAMPPWQPAFASNLIMTNCTNSPLHVKIAQKNTKSYTLAAPNEAPEKDWSAVIFAGDSLMVEPVGDKGSTVFTVSVVKPKAKSEEDIVALAEANAELSKKDSRDVIFGDFPGKITLDKKAGSNDLTKGIEFTSGSAKPQGSAGSNSLSYVVFFTRN